MKHKIGEILNIDSADGEFYVYGFIDDVQLIHIKEHIQYPTGEDIEVIQSKVYPVTFKHEWLRSVPTNHTSDYTFMLYPAKKHSRGAMPVTIVEW